MAMFRISKRWSFVWSRTILWWGFMYAGGSFIEGSFDMGRWNGFTEGPRVGYAAISVFIFVLVYIVATEGYDL